MVALPVRTVVRGNPPNAAHQVDPGELTDLLEQIQSSAATNGALVAFRDTVAGLDTVTATSGQSACVLATDDTSGIYEYDGSVWSKVGPLPVIIGESSYAQQVAEIAAQFGDVAAAIAAAQAWAEGTEPGGPGTKSAKEAAQDAETSAQTAEKWASEDEDVLVSGGKYSAMHYMLKSEATLTQVAAILDTFDDRFLGALASDPATDNDGDPLVVGATYFNTTTNLMRIYNGSDWQIFGTDVSLALLKANNLSDLPNVTTARKNLGFSMFFQTLIGSADLGALWGLLYLGSVAGQGFTDNDNLTVNPGDIGTRGNMAAAILSIGLNASKMAEISASRSAGTVYQNTNNYSIIVTIRGYKASASYGEISVSDDNVSFEILTRIGAQSSSPANTSFVVGPQQYYKVESGTTIYQWSESA